MKFTKLFIYFFLWRILLVFLACIGFYLLPFHDSFPYRESVLVPFGHPLFYSWANFDGVHYLGIARQGYFADYTQAFFPLFPLTVRWINFFFDNLLFSGLLVSHLALIITISVFYKLIRLDYSQKSAVTSIIFLLLFPGSFFLGSFYSESLFLLLTVSCFYAMRTQRQGLAILFALLASATRLVGVFLIPALLVEKHMSLKKSPKSKSIIVYLPLILPIVGLLLYMGFLQQNYSDALYFLHAQPAFGAQRSADKLILPYQVIYRYFRMVTSVSPNSLLFFTVAQEFALSLFFIGLSLLAFRRLRLSYSIFSFLTLFTPTLTGTFSSMPRYILSAFPLFILLGTIKSIPVKRVLVIVSVILISINTILFTRGYWVS